MSLDRSAIIKLIKIAFKEDLPKGDVTCRRLVPKGLCANGHVIAKGDYIVSGIEVAKLCYQVLDSKVRFETFFRDGDAIKQGQTLFKVSGNARSLLKAERTVLNIVSHMMGVATKTRSIVDVVKGTNAVILDTRKTLPGLRGIQKMAVVHGGGTNHRWSLSDAVLVKENHIACAGGVEKAVSLLKGVKLKKEIEVRTLGELGKVLNSDVKMDVVMLDNMTPTQVKDAVQLVGGKIKLEVSGGINETNIRAYAEAGADFISIGSLTHSVQSADLSFLFEGV